MIVSMVNGVFNIDKPPGITSHDAVQHIRRAVGRGLKVGHAGTLDPFATGILVIAVGSATRLLEYMHMLPKTYKATFVLGSSSDTDDVTGVITPIENPTQPTQDAIDTALDTFTGELNQIPPQYAAIKIAGKKMYELAREGKNIEAKPRNVTVREIVLTRYQYPEIDVTITCSAGTYIRAIGRDLGQALDTGAYTKTLRRTHIGSFDESGAVPLKEITESTYSNHLLPAKALVAHLPHIELTQAQQQDFVQGKMILDTTFAQEGPHAIFTPKGELIGIGKKADTGELQPDKVLSL